jgi:hypothetical protein
LSVRDAACRDDGTDDDDGADLKRVAMRECSAIAATWLALEGIIGMP